MRSTRVVLAAILAGISTTALAQNVGQADHNVNRTGTIGPTVTANPPNDANVVHAAKDPDAGEYGVPGGVGDPSIGSKLTASNTRFATAPSSLRTLALHHRRVHR